ncbi:MAG: hypothetical protein ACYSSI_06060 [Planctomycetota bacterium]
MLFRTMRNIVVMVISTCWLIPLHAFFNELLHWLYDSHQADHQSSIDCGFRIELALSFLSIALVWLGIVIAFWVFIATRRIWPSKERNVK